VSDELTRELSRELTRGLRELAQGAEAPPPVPGAEVRRAAVRRRRRRRGTAALAGGSAAAALAVLLAVNLTGSGTEDRPVPPAGRDRPVPPAGPAGTPSTPATTDATVDLSRRVLVIGERELPVSAGSQEAPTPTGRMTVTDKVQARTASGVDAGFADDYTVKIPWAITLRAADGSTTFIGAMTYDEKAPGTRDRTRRWIGLREDDARWVYERLAVGAVVEVTSSPGLTSTPTSTSTPTPTLSSVPNREATPTSRASDAEREAPAETSVEASAEPPTA
jgi:hypothetical protein